MYRSSDRMATVLGLADTVRLKTLCDNRIYEVPPRYGFGWSFSNPIFPGQGARGHFPSYDTINSEPLLGRVGGWVGGVV